MSNASVQCFYENVNFYKKNEKFDKKLMSQLTTYFLKFIEKAAYFKQQKTSSDIKFDLIQAGVLGLYSAVKSYKDDLNVHVEKKNNFTIFYIKRFIMAYINNEFNFSRNLIKNSSKLSFKMKKYYAQIESKAITIEKVAEELGVTVFEVENMIQSQKTTLSIEKQNDEEDSSEEYLESNSVIQTDFIELKNLYDGLYEACNSIDLDEREKDILTLFMKNGDSKDNYDKVGEYPMSFADIAEKHSVSRERIRQLSEKVKEKIKKQLLKNKITKETLSIFG